MYVLLLDYISKFMVIIKFEYLPENFSSKYYLKNELNKLHSNSTINQHVLTQGGSIWQKIFLLYETLTVAGLGCYVM